MKVDVNGTCYNVEIVGNKVQINGKELDFKLNAAGIIISGTPLYLDFFGEGDPSLLIINGMSYLVSKRSGEISNIKELKAPISGVISEVLVSEGNNVKKGQPLLVLEAMKMENQMRSPVSGKIKEVKVKKGQLAKSGEVLLIFY